MFRFDEAPDFDFDDDDDFDAELVTFDVQVHFVDGTTLNVADVTEVIDINQYNSQMIELETITGETHMFAIHAIKYIHFVENDPEDAEDTDSDHMH